MSKQQKWAAASVLLCVIGFLLTVFDFLALHDIHNEYVSPHILNQLHITTSVELPPWTRTKGEWNIIRISYIFRSLLFIALCVGLSGFLYRSGTSGE